MTDNKMKCHFCGNGLDYSSYCVDCLRKSKESEFEAGRQAAFDELDAKKRVTIQTKYGLLSFDVKKKGVR